MRHLFKKKQLLSLFTLVLAASTLVAGEKSCDRFYIGAFGGGLYSSATNMAQTGTAFFTEEEGGPLDVNAFGRSGKNSSGFGGVQLGHEWSRSLFKCSDWQITPAAELEAYWFRQTKRGDLINPTTRLDEHDFLDTFPMNVGTYLANGVFSFHSRCLGCLTPYIGGGVGAARISIRNADSTQVEPPEEGINHFNSNTNDFSWAFAAQAKAGLRYRIFNCAHIFAEYRYLYLDTSKFIFGSTVDPEHAPTSTWNVSIRCSSSNAFAVGLQYDL